MSVTTRTPHYYCRFGGQLGFIEKVVLVDGTIVENLHALWRSPIPTEEQCELILRSAHTVSCQCLGTATPEWSSHPEMVPKSLFEIDDDAFCEISATKRRE